MKKRLKVWFKSRKHLEQPTPESPASSAKSPALLICSIILLLVSFSLFSTIIPWISLLVVCSVVVRFALFFAYQKPIPTTRTLNLLALLSALGLMYSALPLGFLIGMVNLLVLACALKLMQVRSQRDFYQLIASLLFLIACGFIFEQSLGFTVFYSVLTLAVLLSLGFYHGPNLPIKQQFKQLFVLSLQALPIGVLLFLLLPQLPPLWQTPKAKSAQSGLTEKVTPGDIAQLSQSSELAFRATFDKAAPPINQRYWRTIVMEEFDGKSWQIHPWRKQQKRQMLFEQQEFMPQLYGPYFDYDVIAEPSQQPWLFSLDIGVPRGSQNQANIWQSPDFQLIYTLPLSSQTQYLARTYPQSLERQVLTDIDKRINLTLPNESNPQTRIWVNQLRQQYRDDAQFVAALLNYFKTEGFSYTLRPNPMFNNPVDTFLFEKKAGFCSHFASALAFSLRLGGIPARLVTGYQGGELSAKKNQSAYLSVYQYDAHAWVEAWSPNKGWQRLDPTALVSPDRINFGLRQAMQEEGSFLADSPFSLARLTNVAIFNSLRLFLADVDYNWSRWVIGFNSHQQQQLFKLIIGELTPQRLALLGLAIVLIIALLLLLFYVLKRQINALSPELKTYNQALFLLEQRGLAKPHWQGPVDFAAKVKRQQTAEVARYFCALTNIYVQHCYQATTAQSNTKKRLRKQLSLLNKALKHSKRRDEKN